MAESREFYGPVVVGERGQIVIPKEARAHFAIKPGDKLIMLGKPGGGLVLLKAEAMREFARKILEKV
ncbi:AbrB/MazE/SpoVT family DNA-binding domain-containing protein [Candidatus Micrarchaeota archaeon]|nr:AbrB/MazE/SpoVT family DNA-binding domain-containing protein [Candidatus Micrarchaeota archaeon]